MKTLSNPDDAAEIRTRLLALTAEDQREWGVMSVTQMLCHLRVTYLFALSPDPIEHISLAVSPKVAKYVALRSPLRWPKNLPTPPDFKVGSASMATTTFAKDHASLLEAFDRFCAAGNLTKTHPYFTSMIHADWTHWGYLHADHHLRQFGH
jgi:Protein of unknown function (DUF1569)